MELRNKLAAGFLSECPALRYSLAYLVISCLWILSSDQAIEFMVSNPETHTQLQSFKGLFFVGISALLIYVLVETAYARGTRQASGDKPRQLASRPIALIILLFFLAIIVGGFALYRSAQEEIIRNTTSNLDKLGSVAAMVWGTLLLLGLVAIAVRHFAKLTAQRETENALRNREKQLLKAEEHAKLGHWEIDLESGNRVWSPQMYRLFERDPACGPAAPDEAYAEYYTPDSARLTQQSVRQAITTGERIQIEQELQFPGHRTAYHAMLIVPIRNEQGRTIALHGTVQDVTEQKLNEVRLAKMASRLAQSAREYEDLYQNAPCGYHSLDKNGVFQRINDTELHWLGYSRDELVGKMSFSDLLPPDRLAGFHRGFPRLIESGQLNDLEQNLICKDGTLLPVLINATVIRDESGRFLMSRSTTYNMTERKKIEKEREAYSTRLTQLSRRLVNMQELERKQLSASLHDRTSPNLAAIGLNLSIIGMPGSAPISPELAERLEDIRALLDDTTASIREISSDLRPPLLDYAGLFPALEAYLYQFSRRTGIATHFECPEFTARPSPEQETLLFRIAQEALTNCAKHAAANEIEVALSKKENKLVLSIRDNGIGFEVDKLGKDGSDIGLGMLNMREMTEFAGGQFIIDTSPGKGTSIRVEIQ